MKAARLAFSLWAASRARGNHDLSTRRAVGGQPAAAGRGRASGGVCTKDNKCRAAPSAGAPQEREPGTFLTGHQTNPQPAPVCLPGQGRQMLLPGLSRPHPHHRTAQCPAEPARVARRFVICRYETRALPRAVGHRDTPRRRHTRPRAGWRLRLVPAPEVLGSPGAGSRPLCPLLCSQHRAGLSVASPRDRVVGPRHSFHPSFIRSLEPASSRHGAEPSDHSYS